MTGNPKVVKDPFYAENRINPGVARAEPGIAVFGINGVTPNVLIITSSDVNI